MKKRSKQVRLPAIAVMVYSYIQALPYTWKQQLADVDIEVPVPKGTRAKQLNVVLQKKKLSVGLKGEEPIMSGELCKEIKMEDSTWTVGESFEEDYRTVYQ